MVVFPIIYRVSAPSKRWWAALQFHQQLHPWGSQTWQLKVDLNHHWALEEKHPTTSKTEKNDRHDPLRTVNPSWDIYIYIYIKIYDLWWTGGGSGIKKVIQHVSLRVIPWDYDIFSMILETSKPIKTLAMGGSMIVSLGTVGIWIPGINDELVGLENNPIIVHKIYTLYLDLPSALHGSGKKLVNSPSLRVQLALGRCWLTRS